MRRGAALLLVLAICTTASADVACKRLAPGLELCDFAAKRASRAGDSRITVVRIDPASWQLELVGAKDGKTAREWAKGQGFAVATNAGMFATDYKTHVGYMEARGQVHSGHVNAYQSVAAFDPRDPAKPPFRIFDLDDPGVTLPAIRGDYASILQNLRLIKRPGSNRWSAQSKQWSEAALGEDREGRILFIFSRSPFSMHDLNRELLTAGIGLVAAQHLEGGPEAQLYVHVGEVELEMFGSYETFFREDDGNANAWPIPNVLGVKRP